MSQLFMNQLFFILFSVVTGALGQIAFKHGMNRLGRVQLRQLANLPTARSVALNPFILLGFGLYAASSIIWLGLLSSLEISFLYPLISIGYIITTIFAITFLKEKVSLQRWVGTGIIVAGSALILLS